MGLTSWAGGIVRKGDVSTGKNYLTKEELAGLNSVVTMYLDFAENQAKRRLVVTMADWKEKLDAFLQFNGHELLTNAGSVRAEVAKKLAEDRYGAFDAKRKTVEAVAASQADFAEIERLSRKEGEQQ